MGFPRQEYWSGFPFSSPGDLPNMGMEPGSPALQADSLQSEPPEKPIINLFFVFNDNFKVVRCYCLCYFYYIWQLSMLKTLFLQYYIHLQILNTMTIENLVLFQIYKFPKSILTYQLLRKHTFKSSGMVCWTPNIFGKKNQFLTCSVTETHTYIFGNKLIYSQMRSMRMLGKLY